MIRTDIIFPKKISFLEFRYLALVSKVTRYTLASKVTSCDFIIYLESRNF